MLEAVVFHGITAVAELKPRIPNLVETVPHGFPRHHCRGRIEARTGRLAASGQCPSFPRHHCRGRIEAWKMEQQLSEFLVFHGITAVAELKLSVSGSVGGLIKFSTASLPWPN